MATKVKFLVNLSTGPKGTVTEIHDSLVANHVERGLVEVVESSETQTEEKSEKPKKNKNNEPK